MTDKTYTAAEVKVMLAKSMEAIQAGMVGIIRECAEHETYQKQTAKDALHRVADRLEVLK
jgi:hypothetical protein